MSSRVLSCQLHWGLCIERCLKRRLSVRNAKVQLLTLTVLETLVKNCGASFQSDLAQSDLWTDVASLADPRRKGDMQVVDKVMVRNTLFFFIFNDSP